MFLIDFDITTSAYTLAHFTLKFNQVLRQITLCNGSFSWEELHHAVECKYDLSLSLRHVLISAVPPPSLSLLHSPPLSLSLSFPLSPPLFGSPSLFLCPTVPPIFSRFHSLCGLYSVIYISHICHNILLHLSTAMEEERSSSRTSLCYYLSACRYYFWSYPSVSSPRGAP